MSPDITATLMVYTFNYFFLDSNVAHKLSFGVLSLVVLQSWI